MCGITGKIVFEKKEITTQEIEKMNDAIKHRGPDDGGVYISPDKCIGLGHRRLSIIDLSPLGHQPMRYLDRYEIVFNGEIYNYQESRELLKKDGYSFVSSSDTEVIMALYDKYGKDCLRHLRGMFSFVIYDEKEKTIFCVRDRVGKKPFKYYLDDKIFIFASELKAILTQPEYEKKPDYEAIHHYLTLQYVPAPLTGFKNIKKLEPAHYLFLDLKTRKLEHERYWKLDYSVKLNLTETEWKKQIIEKLEESVKLRMISDVPIGAFLSGGIDSSAIVALMAKNSKAPIKTFSIGFGEEKFNELKYARKIADKFKTDHTEFVVKPDAVHLLPMLVKQFEEPYADSSALPTYYVSKLTRDHVTVALNGDGGDENFAGYPRYSIHKFALLYDKIGVIHKMIVLPLAKIIAMVVKRPLFDRAYRFARSISKPFNRRYVEYICYFTNEMKNNLYTDEMMEKTKELDSYDFIADRFADSGSRNKAEQAVYADFVTYLPDDLMTKVDIDSMAVSLEGRSPFLDHEFLELTAQIPMKLKLKGWNNKKYILKEALRGIVPDEVMFRPKMGFSVPIHDWFRNELKDYVYATLFSEKALKRGLFRADKLREFVDNHCNTKLQYGNHVWALITLELWFQEYFD